MRTIWNGSLSFGLVSIPVGLAPATATSARQSDVSFKLLHRECLTPIKQKRWCSVHDREVGPDEIVKGWEVAKGEFVVVEDADLEAIQLADDSRAIEINRFVALEQVDPVFFDSLGHVGLYIGGGEFVHAPHTGTDVQVSSLDSGSYASSYVGARRVR